MKTLIFDFLSLLFPRPCVICHQSLLRSEEWLCFPCLSDLPKLTQQSGSNEIIKKFAYQNKVTQCIVYLKFNKGGKAQKLLYMLKYKGMKALGYYLGKMFAEERLKNLDVEVIIPLPLHKKRKIERGYNQSEEIALGIADVLKIPMTNDIVARIKQTTTQTQKGKVERWENVSDAFAIIKPEKILKKKILIVDDVITTSASLGALCDEVAAHHPESIAIVALATP